MGCRRLHALITNLPGDAALWRAQGRVDSTELAHEWAMTFIQFMAGKKVKTPAMVRAEARKKVRPKNNLREIMDWFHRNVSGHGDEAP